MTNDSESVWSNEKLILFRFVFSYLVLYNFLSPLNLLPKLSFVYDFYTEFWHIIGVWVGKLVFQKDITVFTNGSGDTTYDYILVFCYFSISLITTIIWTLLDRKRANYSRLFQFLYIYIRFVLALTMIFYGVTKVLPLQFPSPSLAHLLQPLGEFSPMGLLWNFIGYSYAFGIFVGLGETIGGLLLAFKRTILLGSLILIAVLANVVMFNFTYDIPVKLYSVHLLLMSFFILLPDLERLVNFLFNKPVAPAVYKPLFTKPLLNRWIPFAASLFIILCTFYMFYEFNELRKTIGDLAPKSPFYGIWNVEELEIAGEVQPALLSNETRWRRVVFDSPRRLSVQLVNDSITHYSLKTDEEKKTFNLSKRDAPNWKPVLAYNQPDPEQMILEGTFEDKQFRAKLRCTTKQFVLIERGFNWINEYPFEQ